ncbi:hypothetical protein [Rubellimicrobium roseum]|uniref:Uncharacterized protein n=1 Tax=Rubellimicrobium roseum TaxID=687525 RepID=A0A5C4NP90_9RHOB|nr:hypothetical protein [Rubellimicrobium roseum]TNC74876.1 hypothetical protein FHG71_01720 [Rubellimicrobium roseum]
MPLVLLLLVILFALSAAAAGLALGHSIWMAFAIYAGVVQLAALGALAAPPLARAAGTVLARLTRSPSALGRAAASPAAG